MDSEAVGAWIEAATEEGAGEEGAPGVRLARLWTRWEEEAEAEGAEARGRWTSMWGELGGRGGRGARSVPGHRAGPGGARRGLTRLCALQGGAPPGAQRSALLKAPPSRVYYQIYFLKPENVLNL